MTRASHGHIVTNAGVWSDGRPVNVSRDRPRNDDGSHFRGLVTHLTAEPKPGSNEVNRAFEEARVGAEGYPRPDGTRPLRAPAFHGHVGTASGDTISEAFIVDRPKDMTVPGEAGPLDGTAPRPDACVFSPDGRRIAFVRTPGDGPEGFYQVFVVEVGSRPATAPQKTAGKPE